MTSGGAGAAATEAAVSLNWRPGPVPLWCLPEPGGPSVHPWGFCICGQPLAGKLRLHCWDLMH